MLSFLISILVTLTSLFGGGHAAATSRALAQSPQYGHSARYAQTDSGSGPVGLVQP
jgi:hypothetical protein